MPAVPTVKRLMTPFPYAVQARAQAGEAGEMMAEHGMRHLPVVSGRAVIGVLSHRELSVAVAVGGSAATVADICTRDPYMVEHHTPANEVAATMARRQIGSAIVMHDGNLAGIVTTTDICRAYAELHEPRALPPDAPA